jgi:hypothetical protein
LVKTNHGFDHWGGVFNLLRKELLKLQSENSTRPEASGDGRAVLVESDSPAAAGMENGPATAPGGPSGDEQDVLVVRRRQGGNSAIPKR